MRILKSAPHPPSFLPIIMSNSANDIAWTIDAEAKLKEIPFFVRSKARVKIEKFAQERGTREINVEIYELAKQQFRK